MSSHNNTKKVTSMKPAKIGRPINCFMAFRLEKHQEISAQSPGLNHRDISKIIAKWWKEASETEKAPYRAIASKAKADHAKQYPNYKYRPIKKSERQVRPYKRREDAATRQKKAMAKEEIMKQWLGESFSSISNAPSPASDNAPSPASDGSSSFCDSPLTLADFPSTDFACTDYPSADFFLPDPLSESLYHPMYSDLMESKSIDSTLLPPSSTLYSYYPYTTMDPYSSDITLPEYVNLQMLSLYP